MAPWLREVTELIHTGKRDEAIALTRRLADAGDLAARARLARFGEEAGLSPEQADRLIDDVEELHSPDDATAHWVLRGAYDVGLGTCEYEEKSRRVLRHLEAYARLTQSPTATYAVAVNYYEGNIGTPPNPQLGREWLTRAAELGHEEAMDALRRERGV